MNKLRKTMKNIGSGLAYAGRQTFKAGKQTKEFLRNQKEASRKKELEDLDHQYKMIKKKELLLKQREKLQHLKQSYIKKIRTKKSKPLKISVGKTWGFK